MKMNFELSKPFLPFEQLMAVLPAASKKLIPDAFKPLMLNENSPIIDFYPTEFEQDLNGKQQDWEAVVLVSFIDEARLLEAMKPLHAK
jgi:5'-3' exoribonuclease 1